jgi:LPS-assembly protein
MFFGLLSAAAASEVDLPKAIPDEPFDLQADRMEYTNDTFIASGSVTGRFENVLFLADKVTGNAQTGDLYAEGNIHFERDNTLWQGTELEYNFMTQEGLFGPSSLYFDPIHMSVDHVERVATNEYRLQGSTFTTCPKEAPHTRMRAREASLIDEQYVRVKGATFYAGKVPVMYLPYWKHRIGDRIFTFRLGYGSRLGGFALTTTTLPVTKEIDSLTDINLYDRRGVGFGQGFIWDYPEAEGEFRAFYLEDQDPYARYDSPEAKDQISKDRYRFKLEHIQNFTDTDYINTKWNYLSDPAVVEEFFKQSYRTEAQPENYASLVNGGSYLGSEAFISRRLNSFYDNTDIYEYSLDFYRSQLGDSPFYFESKNSIGRFEQVFAKTNRFADEYSATRIDSENTVYVPQRFGFLNVIPRASYRATYYSKTEELNGEDEEVRQLPGAGVEASFQATRILSDTDRWYGKGLRHKIEPYADYSYTDSSISTNRLLQFDDVDKLSDENRVKLGLRNVLQTKRAGRLSRFVDLDLYTYYLVDRNDAEDDFSPLFIDARMPLTQRVIVDMEGIYDWYEGKIKYFNTRASYTRDDDVILSLEHQYQEPERLSLWTPRIDLYPNGNISFESYLRYDDNENEIQEVAFEAYKNFCCMRYGLGYHYYDDGDQSIMFSIGLSAFPSARIASGF